MTLPSLRYFWIVLMILTCHAAIFGQALSWETTTVIPMGDDQTIVAKVLYAPRMFKEESDDEGTIFRLDKQMIYTFDNARREYSEISFTELEKVVKQEQAQFEQQMAEVKKHLENLPAEQRAEMEKMMGKEGAMGSAAAVDVKKTDTKETINGFSCVKYLLLQEGKELGSVWTTTDVPDFASMQKDFQEFAQRTASQMTMLGPQMGEAMKKVQGFPVRTTIAGMTATSSKITRTAISGGAFEIPKGFKKIPWDSGRGKRNDEMQETEEDGKDEGEDNEKQ